MRGGATLHEVVSNTRFLILPWVHSPGQASKVLGPAERRLLVDWQQRYGFALALLQTFVESPRHTGTCHHADTGNGSDAPPAGASPAPASPPNCRPVAATCERLAGHETVTLRRYRISLSNDLRSPQPASR
jgi:hypothetical protein